MNKFHQPVLLKKTIRYLKVEQGKKYIDATVGGGGHAEAILKPGGKVLGIDCDPEAIEAARNRLAFACPLGDKKFFWRLAWGNFRNLRRIARMNDFPQVAGILFDLGVSSHQLEKTERGFSFNPEGPLDMRMDPRLKVTAADLVNGLTKGELNELFAKIGQEHYSWRIADAICRARRLKTIQTVGQLVNVINRAIPKKKIRGRLHPATRCFLALRIAVNDEFNNLRQALPQAVTLLEPEGRLVVISFHSGEDRIAKQFFRDAKKCEKIRILTEKPMRPTVKEIKQNPRSRSAKLRVAEKR